MSNDLLTCKICGQYSGGYSCIILKAIQLCAATKGVVLGPFWSEDGYKRRSFWSGIGFGFRGTYWSVCLNVVMVSVPHE